MTPLLSVEFPHITAPVGTGPRGYWTHYKALDAKGQTQVRVQPVLSLQGMDLDTSDPMIFCDLNLYFESQDWDESTLGMIYTDGAFEAAIQAWARTNGLDGAFGDPSYTEQGMQGDNYVSMAFATQDVHTLAEVFGSQHATVAWLAKAQEAGWTVQHPD